MKIDICEINSEKLNTAVCNIFVGDDKEPNS